MRVGTKQYTIDLKEKKWESWHEHKENNPQYGTLSQLVRSAVEEQIQRDNRDDDQLTKEQQQIITKIQSENARVLDRIEAIQDLAQDIEGKQITLAELETTTKQVVRQENQHLISEYTGDSDE